MEMGVENLGQTVLVDNFGTRQYVNPTHQIQWC